MANDPGDSGIPAEGRFGERAGFNLISIVTSLFGLFFGGVDKNTKRALEGVRKAQVDTANELSKFAGDTGGWFARLVGFLRGAWDSIILAALKKLDHAIGAIADWLKRTFGPLIQFLRDVRKYILDWYNKYVRPIVDTIEVVRRILQLGSFLGIEAAKKLDQKLAALERRIREPLDKVVLRLNRVIDTVDLVMTLDGFLQRYTLIRSMALYQRDMWNALFHPALADVDAAKTAALAHRQVEKVDAAYLGHELRSLFRRQASDLAEQVDALVPLVRSPSP